MQRPSPLSLSNALAPRSKRRSGCGGVAAYFCRTSSARALRVKALAVIADIAEKTALRREAPFERGAAAERTS
jgi:hypothetical protein